MHRRGAGVSPYDMARPYNMADDAAKYPFERVFHTAELASQLDPGATDELRKSLADKDSAVRYWAVLGLLMRGKEGVGGAQAELRRVLADDSPEVRIAAAEALARFGEASDLAPALAVLTDSAADSKGDVFTVMAALAALEDLDNRAAPAAEKIRALRGNVKVPHPRYSSYVPRLLESLQGQVLLGSP